jgi:hypothetical protein
MIWNPLNFFLIRIVGGGVQAGSSRHVGHLLAWPEPGSNPGRCGGKPATNRLSYGAANPLK